MDSRELTAEQLAKIQEAIAPCRKFLLHLMLRTEEIFKPSDELYIAAHEAQAAMQSLFVTVHYLKCRHGVGKPTPGLVPQQITQGEPMPILVESRRKSLANIQKSHPGATVIDVTPKGAAVHRRTVNQR